MDSSAAWDGTALAGYLTSSARPAVMPPAPATAAYAADPAPADAATPVESDLAVAGSQVTEEPTSGAASSVAGSDSNGGQRNYRLRRSALEALPVRVPSVKELVSSRFAETEVSFANGKFRRSSLMTSWLVLNVRYLQSEVEILLFSCIPQLSQWKC